MVETLAGQGAAVHSYLHVWEIDAVQPRIRLPIGRRLSHYAGIGSVRKKFEQLLSDFQYGPVYDTIVQGRY